MSDNSALQKRVDELEEKKRLQDRLKELEAETGETPKKGRSCGRSFGIALLILFSIVCVAAVGFFGLVLGPTSGVFPTPGPTRTPYPTMTPLPTHPAGNILNPYPTSTYSGLKPVDVPWATVLQFLNTDLTYHNKYNAPGYVCVQFAMDVVSNANRAGIAAHVVYLKFVPPAIPGWKGPFPGHVIVGFPTTDRGVVYYDPQMGSEVTIAVGQSECTLATKSRSSRCMSFVGGELVWNPTTKSNFTVPTEIPITPYIISEIWPNAICNFQTARCSH